MLRLVSLAHAHTALLGTTLIPPVAQHVPGVALGVDSTWLVHHSAMTAMLGSTPDLRRVVRATVLIAGVAGTLLSLLPLSVIYVILASTAPAISIPHAPAVPQAIASI